MDAVRLSPVMEPAVAITGIGSANTNGTRSAASPTKPMPRGSWPFAGAGDGEREGQILSSGIVLRSMP